jgi:glycosyltransferase involved in cell wall biosynthesis
MLPASANAKASSSHPLLSIVLTSYTDKRLKDIFELLESVKAQTYPRIEVVYVIERSTGLLHLLRSYLKEKAISNVKVIFDSRDLGLSAARNLGIKNAGGEIIAFIDDDVVLPPEWAEEVVRTYAMRSDIIGVTGPALPLWSDGPIKWLPEELYWIIGSTTWYKCNSVKEVRHAWGMNMSFRREAFEVCGGFRMRMSDYPNKDVAKRMLTTLYHDIVPHEDVDFSLRVRRKTGKRILYNPKLAVMHKAKKSRLTISFIIKECLHQGCAKRMLTTLYPMNANMLRREYDLLFRILRDLLPNIFTHFLRDPFNSWRRFSITMFTLFFLGLGYCSPVFFKLLTRKNARMDAKRG